MLVIMGGYPFCGKTTLVNKFSDYNDLIIINQELFIPDDVDEFGKDDESNVKIAAWQCVNDQVIEEIKNNDDDEKLIIYDTCGANLGSIKDILKENNSKHSVIYFFLKESISICIKRSGLNKNIYDNYNMKFRDVLKYVKKCFDVDLVLSKSSNCGKLFSNIVEGWNLKRLENAI